jgi:hypothetical protein
LAGSALLLERGPTARTGYAAARGVGVAWKQRVPAASGAGLTASVTLVVSRTFELDGVKRPFTVMIGLVLLPASVFLLVVGEDGGSTAFGLFFIAVACWVIFEFGFWAPHRVTLDDSGISLDAVARRVRIAWDDLESVEPTPWDLRRETLRWRRSRGRAITTLNAFPELHRMLVEIERRAPRAYVSS